MSKKELEKSRRDFLVKSMSVVPVLTFSGMALDALTALSSWGAVRVPAARSAREYKPVFFNPEEFEFIKAAVARLIPSDNLGPGALEAGVPEFIDRQMQTPYGAGANWYMRGPFHPDADPALGYQLPLTPREVYRLGIAEANKHSRKIKGKLFHKLADAERDVLLELMESGKMNFSEIPAKAFFSVLLQNTREGFFSDPIHGGNQGLVGWKLIGFPGARADFVDWVERGERYPFPPVSITGKRG